MIEACWLRHRAHPSTALRMLAVNLTLCATVFFRVQNLLLFLVFAQGLVKFAAGDFAVDV